MADLVTLEEYKAYAGINSTTLDDELSVIIPKVSQLVKSICRRTFVDYVNDAKVEYHSGGNFKIVLKEGPVLRLSDVEYSTDSGATYTSLVEFTDFAHDLEDDTLVSLHASGVFPKGTNAYKITYNAGYEVLPEDLKIAVLDLVKYYQKNDGAIHSPKAPGTNTVQIEYVTTTALPAYIKRVLDLYTWSYA